MPLDLDVKLNQGGAAVELGGLWLTAARFEFAQGGFELQVDEPLREPMDRLVIHGSMGGFGASGIGNASPRNLEVDVSMGGMGLDLRGDWVVDSDITVRLTQGGGMMRLPRDVEIVGLAMTRGTVKGDEELPRPKLTFSVSSGEGELEIIE